jgi:cardiolipin synthase
MKRRLRAAAQKALPYPWWILALAAIGAIALVAVIITLFFAFGRRPSHLQATEAPAVESAEFLRAVAGAAGAPLRSGGSIRLLNNGDEFFPALLTALRGARRTITFSVYIWEPGGISDKVVAALVDRARAGVEVRLLLDGLGARDAPKEGLQALRSAGAKVEMFRSPRLGKFTRFHKRNHRRAIVIDGELAFTGGMAIGDKWLGNADSPEHWRDTMVEVRGPMASTVQSAFVAPWAHSTGELLAGEQFFPSGEGAPSAAANRPIHTGVASAPSSEDHPLRLFFTQAFVSAKRRLYIATPYYVPDKATRDSIAAAAKRGVDVRLLLPNEHIDSALIRYTAQAYYEELLSAGVRVYEYQPTFMHSKFMVVDGRWTIVGSANLDIRSKELNEENVLGVLDESFGADVEATFRKDLAASREIKLAEWKKRGPFQRFNEWASSRFAEQY